MTSYATTPRVWYVRDTSADAPAERLAYHVKMGDCFATLATAVGLAEDALRDAVHAGEPPPATAFMLLTNVREDLMRLHTDYRVRAKDTVL